MEKNGLIDRLTNKLERLLQTKYSLFGIAVISFFESALVVPIITDPFMVAYILANRSKTTLVIIVTIFSSLLGGVVAYFMGMFFSTFMLAFLSTDSITQFYQISENFKNQTFIFTIIGAVTPIPYTLVALAAGFVKGSLLMFILGTIVGRTFRYSIVGYITYRIGPRSIKLIQENIIILSAIVLLIIASYYLFFY